MANEDILSVKNFGPFKGAEVAFGDLTVLVGPQASGKSLFLELFKLLKDRGHIISTLKRYNYVLGESSSLSLLEYYFGEGMYGLLKGDSDVKVNGRSKTNLLRNSSVGHSGGRSESVFFVPAQRILSIADGRPKNFMEFDLTTPYPLRYFSETLRVFLQSGLGNPDVIFPMPTRLKKDVKELINSTIFHNGEVIIDSSGSQRKMKLSVDGMRLPFMTWSAGQKEFMPLLLAIYCLSGPPTAVVNKDGYKWVVIEEPEMGLHPKAIESVIIELLELLNAGYKVVISTHSSMFLEFIWAINSIKNLSQSAFKKGVSELMGISASSKLLDNIREKVFKTYYFENSNGEGVVSKDISSLDVMDDDKIISEWGGLSNFATRCSEIVSNYSMD